MCVCRARHSLTMLPTAHRPSPAPNQVIQCFQSSLGKIMEGVAQASGSAVRTSSQRPSTDEKVNQVQASERCCHHCPAHAMFFVPPGGFKHAWRPGERWSEKGRSARRSPTHDSWGSAGGRPSLQAGARACGCMRPPASGFRRSGCPLLSLSCSHAFFLRAADHPARHPSRHLGFLRTPAPPPSQPPSPCCTVYLHKQLPSPALSNHPLPNRSSTLPVKSLSNLAPPIKSLSNLAPPIISRSNPDQSPPCPWLHPRECCPPCGPRTRGPVCCSAS